MKVRTETFVDHSEFNKLVTKTYGRPYNIQQQDGCMGNGTISFSVPYDFESEDFENDTIPERVNDPERGVSFKAWLARDPKAPLKDEEDGGREFGIKLWWERNFYPALGMLIDDLYAKRLLKKGEYMILID